MRRVRHVERHGILGAPPEHADPAVSATVLIPAGRGASAAWHVDWILTHVRCRK